MPKLIEYGNNWIYNAICDKKFKFDSNLNIYKYSNPEFPNKNYKKIFDPKSFMTRGDVINFGGSYRNEYKMIFNGIELKHLYTDIDDYGSVPYDFIVGDNPDEFNIGDFNQLIDHNSINWLSKEKLKEIIFIEKDHEIYGQVKIKNKLWNIYINYDVYNIELLYNDKFNYIIDNDHIYVSIPKKYNRIFKNRLIIESSNNELLKIFILENITDLNLIKQSSLFYLYKKNNKYVLGENIQIDPVFPIIIKNITTYSRKIIFDKNEYYEHKLNKKIDLNKIIIYEISYFIITCKTITKTKDDLIKELYEYMNKKIENYDIITEKIPFSHDYNKYLSIYV